jgi:NAD(P)-dependent dehydrogenase (short-subunit alcohol dehydrogenase family)
MQRGHRPEVVVVTGASAGVGRATVRTFARQGAHIGLLARGPDGLEAARQEVEAAGGKALVLPTDVANDEQVEAAAAAVEAVFGPIDIWVNNAMVSVFSPAKEMTPEEFRRVTEVTYLGTVYGTMAALRRMQPRDHGTIVQVGSALAYRGIPLQAAYCGAKHAIQGFTESLRCELLHDGSHIRLTMVQLPALNTPQFGWVKSRLPRKAQPVPPIYQPEVAAEAIVWAAHHERRELNVGLSTSLVLLGNKLAPGVGDHYLAWTGYDGQQTDEPADPNRPHNLWQPLPGDHGAHGDFGHRAYESSPQLWATTHRGWLALASAGIAAVVGAALLGKSQRHRPVAGSDSIRPIVGASDQPNAVKSRS